MGVTTLKEVNAPLGGLGSFAGGSELLLAGPELLYLMHLSVQEVSGIGHLSEH